MHKNACHHENAFHKHDIYHSPLGSMRGTQQTRRPSASAQIRPRVRLLENLCILTRFTYRTGSLDDTVYHCPYMSFSGSCQNPITIPICQATANTGTSRRSGLVHLHLQLCRLLRLRPMSLGSRLAFEPTHSVVYQFACNVSSSRP